MTRVGSRGTRRGRPGSWWDRWLGSWRFAFRLGRREVRRHRGRSALIMALVGAPVLLVTAFLTFFSSQDISPSEGIDRQLGASVAAVGPASGPVGWVMNVGQATDPTDGKVTPGYAADDPWDAARVADTVGSPVVPVGRVVARPEGELSTSVDAGDPLQALVLDGPPGGATQPLASLRSGRWARAGDEVVVTPAGAARGLPESGAVSLVLGSDEEPTTLQVVGVADAAYSADQNAELVLPAATAPAATSWQWLVERTEPVGLVEAQEWALHGLDVTSRELQLHPPDQEWRSENAADTALFYGMIGLAILAETVLLAGPAFAVSAARQRHSLALAGAQGAARADVRRAVVAHGLVLAVVASAGAALVGAVLGLGGAGVLARLRPAQHVGLELPWAWVLPLVLASVVAAGLAAWWPARGATRLDIMSVLRGQVVSGRVGRGWPLVGGVLALAGAGTLVHAATTEPHRAPPWMVGGAALLGLGVMALVPAVLALVSRVSARAPLAWRLAARDALRQRSRAVPAVLAIVAAVAVMTAAATVQVSSTANQERQYTAQVPEGTISVTASDQGDPRSTAALTDLVLDAVADVLPEATAYPLTLIESGPGMDPTGQPTDTPYRTVVPADCTVRELTPSIDRATGTVPHCYLHEHVTYAVAPVAALERTGGLTPQMREVLLTGGLVVWDRGGPEEVVEAARGRAEAQLASAPARATGIEGGTELTGPATLEPVVVYWASSTEMDALRLSRQTFSGGYVTPQTAERLDWDGTPAGVFVAADDPFTLDDAAALGDQLGRDAYVYLERGFVPRPGERILPLVTLGVFSFIALAAVVISTALAISEGRRDSATMAAVGATRRTRRLLASLHAVLVGTVGVLVGLGLGLAVGGVMSWTTTSVNRFGTSYAGYVGTDGIVAVPWLMLGAAAIAVPLIAAAVAWVSVRREPVLTRVLS